MIRFVVLAAPRTGSNWLCSLLDSHSSILCHHEIFNPEGIHVALSMRDRDPGFGTVAERDRDPLAVLQRIWRSGTGRQAVGFKLNRGQHETIFRAVLADAEVRKIVVRRANRVRTFISETLAERTGEWESYAWSRTSGAPPPVRIDPDQLQRHVATNRRYYASIAQALAATPAPAFTVCYEALHTQQLRRQMLQFLGVAPEVALRAGTRRQNAAPLHALIQNFTELQHALHGTELLCDLHDDGLSDDDGGAGG